jgi:hypothetical protein
MFKMWINPTSTDKQSDIVATGAADITELEPNIRSIIFRSFDNTQLRCDKSNDGDHKLKLLRLALECHFCHCAPTFYDFSGRF